MLNRPPTPLPTILLVQVLLFGWRSALAFTTSPPLAIARHDNLPLSQNALSAFPLPTTPLFEHPLDTSTLIALNEDIPLDEAFQDSVSLLDGPIGVLLAAFGAFVVLAVGFKAVMGQMDSAIERVLQEFEDTLKAYYPKRWRVIENTELKGLMGDERDIRLLQVMERLQQEEPDFMAQVASKGAPEIGTVVDKEKQEED